MPAAAAQELHPHAARLALAALVLAALLNLQHLAWWCLPLLLLAAALRWQSLLRPGILPGRAVRAGLALIVTCGVLLSFRTLNGLAAGATLLTAMIAAKLFEAHTRRDGHVLAGATLFLLLAACLDRQQLWRLPLYAACLWLCAATLRGLAGPAPPPQATLLREAGRQLLYSLPLAIGLFVLFPRLPGAFWSMPRDDAAVTGLGDEMNPGAIAHLSESDEPALRVRFDGDLPPPRERYWRGPVLHDFDGQSWRRRRGGAVDEPLFEYHGRAYRYTVTLEPNSHGTVLALEQVRPPDSPDVYYTRDFQLIARRPISVAQSYELTSYPRAAPARAPGDIERYIDLDLPRGLDPRSRELAARLRAAAPGDGAYVDALLDFLRRGGYEYTLDPQRLGRNAVDELLFDTRQGFCGHYASALAFLLRAGGVPARVVTGYQGGEWNPIGRYLVVRQSDAHAWTEAWLEGRGWTRIDPTAVVSPGRIERELLQFGGGLDLRDAGLFGSHRWLAGLLQAWDAAGAWWQDDIVGYNYVRQLRVADWLGFGDRDWRTLAIALGAAMGAWLAWLGWSLQRAARSRGPDPLARAWRRIDARLARAGLARSPSEGVRAYCQRLAGGHAATAATLAPLAEQYLALRYGRPSEDRAARGRELRTFLAAARRWRPAGDTTAG